jgi:membrane-bound serine protease (ClpP class)
MAKLTPLSLARLAVEAMLRYGETMSIRWVPVLLSVCHLGLSGPAIAAEGTERTVFILPIREDIAPPLVYLVRRGVKQAMAERADLLVLDMRTDGGRLDVTEEIIKILNQFKGETVTYVNDRAFSAGAFISAATQKIYMAPQSVIGAAAPVILGPGGTGIQEIPQTFEAKMNSAVRALVRTSAEKNGHNVQVMEAMIDRNKELKIGETVLKDKGDILTLTNLEAEKEYGDPPRPLLSLGTIESLDSLLVRLGYAQARRVTVQPTGAEALASWINRISYLLLIIGIVGIYIELKTPGFGLPGIVGIIAFLTFFFGSYIAGLSGLEWLALFVVGLILVCLELFFFPGTILLGLSGSILMMVALVMAMVDVYPGMPAVPTLPQLTLPLRQLAIAVVVAAAIALAIGRWLPKSRVYTQLVSQSVSGVASVAAQEQTQRMRLGLVGEAVSVLRPGGKARFGEEIIDVITQGEMIQKGTQVRVIGHSGSEAIVESVD